MKTYVKSKCVKTMTEGKSIVQMLRNRYGKLKTEKITAAELFAKAAVFNAFSHVRAPGARV